MIFNAIGSGFLLGLTLAISVSPAFFGLIQTSLRFGFKYGVASAFGIFLSDLTYLLLAYFGISGWLADEKYAHIVGVAGGAVLMFYGISQVLRKAVVQTVDGEIVDTRPTMGALILKGFLMNFLNPVVLFLWIGAMGLASSRFHGEAYLVISFFGMTLATILGTDILKAFSAHKLKSYLNETVIHKVNMVVGIILIIAGIVLVVRTFMEGPWSQQH